MELMQGYKQTDIGLFPRDWSIKKLKEITTLLTNGFVGSAKIHYSENDSDVLYIQGYNVLENSFDFHGIKHVTRSFHSQHQKSSLLENDLLTVQTGDVGLTTIVPKGLVGSNCHALIITRYKKNLVDSKYISFFLNSKQGRMRLKLIETGTTMKHLNCGDMLEFQLPLPPLHEQAAIANALSDMDVLISQTEKLIEKKKAIKQGAMQELLKPKDGWVIKKLGELLKYEQPTAYIVTSTEYHPNNEIPVLTAGKSFILGYTNETNNIFENTPVVIFDDFTTSCQYVDFRFKVKSSAMKILKPANDNVNMRFAFEVLKSIKYQVGDHKRHWIGEFINFEVIIPSKIEEQNRIGQIIEDLEKEQQSYQVKLSKLKQEKEGMMQALLTGKIRLA